MIVAKYGKEAFQISEHFITVTIPLHDVSTEPMMVQEAFELNPTQKRLMRYLREDGTQTIQELSLRLGLSEIAVKKNLQFWKANRHIESIRIRRRKGACDRPALIERSTAPHNPQPKEIQDRYALARSAPPAGSEKKSPACSRSARSI
ncbi:MAG: winged helix-turn-helix transcriptional regulator [Bacillus subtilis]|nr:winged helix-turn-helix transcriptional regulator [Bacillus subtilis]